MRSPQTVAAVFAFLTVTLVYSLSRPSWPSKSPKAFPSSTPKPLARTDSIPNKVWQIWFGGPIDDKIVQQLVSSWILNDQDITYSRVGRQGAIKLVEEHFSHEPEIKTIVSRLQAPAVVSDIMRCLLLYTYGGYYGDIDTHLKKPVAEWLPKDFRDSRQLVVTGIEFDYGNQTELPPGKVRKIALCNWAMAASPGHPMIRKVIDNAILNFNAMKVKYNATVDDLHKHLTQIDTLNLAGPRAWTGAVLDHIGEAYGREFGAADLTGMKKPQLHADVLVLPINAFGAGQAHPGSSGVDTEDTLLRHMFKGTWKHHPKHG